MASSTTTASRAHSYSPRLMVADLGLDPSDPLNLLLHSTSQAADSSMEDSSSSQSDAPSPPDWSQLSDLWPENTDRSASKPYSDIMDFNDLSSLAMDMDFNPSISLDSSDLQFDPMKYATGALHYYDDQGYSSLSNDLLASQFNFSFNVNGSDISSSSASVTSDSPQQQRRLSMTSSSSSSGASLSPVSPSPAAGQEQQHHEMPSAYANDPAAELAHRVRQSAGVMLAVPMGAQLQGHGVNQQVSLPITNSVSSKLAIPRLERHHMASPSASSSAASTPPPSTPPVQAPILSINTSQGSSDPSSVVPTPTTAAPQSGRPKTSHTTIERRYRTNLNARIQSLRMAVPALRVLEDREGNGKKIKKNVKGGVPVKGTPEAEDASEVDVIDERGFVDGVKVARKCSKANVLGKAVEYIKVLKRREGRLKAEQNGLKALIGGLVGGPALLREWENEWRERFGGEERDEVEGEAEAEGDDEDSEDGEEDGDDEVGRKRKRGKVAAAPASNKDVKEKGSTSSQPALANADGTAPEKRKRGRPRKVVLPAVSPQVPLAPAAAEPSSSMQDQTVYQPVMMQEEWLQAQQQQQPRQYLLAVFAVFSFFNSPFSSSSSSTPTYYSPRHHTGTVLGASNPPLAYAPEIVSQFTPVSPAEIVAHSWGWKEYVQLFHVIVSVVVLASFVRGWIGAVWGKSKKAGRERASSSVRRFSVSTKDRKEKMDWMKMAEQSVLAGTSAQLSVFSRLQIYRFISSRRNASVGDLTTAAIAVWGAGGILGNLSRSKARSLWHAAKSQAASSFTPPGSVAATVAEKLVLENMHYAEAAERLQIASEEKGEDGKVYKPIQVLACSLLRERMKAHLGSLFVEAVGVREQEREQDDVKFEELDIRRTVDACKELGGRVGEEGRLLERVWRTPGAVSVADIAGVAGMEEEMKDLMTALVLYRQVFALAKDGAAESSLLSPPPSPRRRAREGLVLKLRIALDSRVFEDVESGLEDARDKVIDLVVDHERRDRAPTP